MSRWKYFNPNPKGLRVGDCTIRAICKAMRLDWETVFVGVYVQSCVMANMPSANCVWGSYLAKNGFRINQIDKHGKDRYTVADFCKDHPSGTYVVCVDGHVVCVEDGYYWDTWDSGKEIPICYYER